MNKTQYFSFYLGLFICRHRDTAVEKRQQRDDQPEAEDVDEGNQEQGEHGESAYRESDSGTFFFAPPSTCGIFSGNVARAETPGR